MGGEHLTPIPNPYDWCSDCSLTHSRFENNGSVDGSSFAHNVYLSASGGLNGTVTDMMVNQNTLTGSAVNQNTNQCSGINLNVHGGTFHRLVLANNIIEEPNAGNGCWGISIDGSSSNPDATYDALISGNIVRNAGNIGIGISACVGCRIENNLIIYERGGGKAIAVPNKITQPPDVDLDRALVRNNTIWFSSSANGTGISVGERGSNHIVVSNIVAFEGLHPTGVCYDYDLNQMAYSLVEANMGFNCGSFDQGTVGLDSWAIDSDPLFVNPPDNFHLQPNSLARDSGSSQSSTTDLLGNPRTLPDRGAYEE